MCLLATGKLSPAKTLLYLYGLADKDNATSIVIVDSDQPAVSGTAISLRVDGVSVGSYPVTYRSHGNNAPPFTIESKLSGSSTTRVENLLLYGSQITLATSGATYSSSLQGFRKGISQLENCAKEVDALQGNFK